MNSNSKDYVYIVRIINLRTDEDYLLTNYDNEVILFEDRFDAIATAKAYIRIPFIEKFEVYEFEYWFTQHWLFPTRKYRKTYKRGSTVMSNNPLEIKDLVPDESKWRIKRKIRRK